MNRLIVFLIIKLIEQYQKISKYMMPRCRFYPTCSQYAKESFAKKGILKGTWFTVIRLLKCQPFHPGGYDPVR